MSGLGRAALGRASRTSMAALVALTLLVPAQAAVVRAAGPTFGTPSATQTFGQSIDFTVPFTTEAGAAGVAAVELRLGFPEALGPHIVDVPVAANPSGTQELRYSLDTSGSSSLAPNTPITATFAARLASGETVTSSELHVLYADTSHTWQTIKGSIISVHWYSGPQSFAQHELAIGEQAIADAGTLLGVTETEPVDFFIYGDATSFFAALGPGIPPTVVAETHPAIRTMFGFITPARVHNPQVAAAVPHEVTHLVFDTAVRNPYRFPPLWVNEGLAVYLSEGYSAQRRSLVEEAVRTRVLVPLDALGGRFPADSGDPTAPDMGFLAYCEAVSAIDYLVRVDGQPALVALVQAYKAGLTDDEAFTRALGMDLASFQAGWLKQLGAQPPARYGPQPAPPGPLPPGWNETAPSASPGTSPGAATTPTSAPGASPATLPGPQTSPGDSGAGMVVVAIVVVILAVAAGLLVARRQTARP